jgi:hypothetical protein
LNKQEDDSLVAWYQMLNTSMNLTAKNIIILAHLHRDCKTSITIMVLTVLYNKNYRIGFDWCEDYGGNSLTQLQTN